MANDRASGQRKEQRVFILVDQKPRTVRGRNITMEASLTNMLYVSEGQLEVPTQFVLRVRGTVRRQGRQRGKSNSSDSV